MKRLSLGEVGLTALLVILAATPSAATAANSLGSEEASLSELHGTTTVSSSRTGAIPLTLPQEAQFPLTPVGIEARPAGFEIEGVGPFTAFLLIQDVPSRTGIRIFGGRWPGDSVLGEQFPYSISLFGTDVNPFADPFLPLPSGRYRLYLITDDDSAATLTLHIEGLAGSVHLTPQSFPRFQMTSLDSRVPGEGVQDEVYSVGQDVSIDDIGFLFLASAVSHTAHAADARSNCLYYGDPEPEAAAYLPGCPLFPLVETFQLTREDVTVAAPYWSRSEFYVSAAPAADYGLGYWQTTAGAVREAGSVAFWLELS